MTEDLDKYFEKQSENQTWVPTKEVAKRFSVDVSTIHKHKDNNPDIIEGLDYVQSMMVIDNVKRKVTLWSLGGINKLSTIHRSDEAKEHRELTTIDPDRILQQIEVVLKNELQPIPQLVKDVETLKNEMVHPITFSKLLRRFSDKRYEVKTKLDINWQKIHDTAKNWTQKSKYEHMSPEEIREGMRRLNELLDSYDKKDDGGN